MTEINLKKADSVEIVLLMDNVFDLLAANQDSIERFKLTTNSLFGPLPIAEHGYSALLKIVSGSQVRTILFDTGVSETGIIHNLDVLGFDLGQLDAIVLSHGHGDHIMGTLGILKKIGRRDLPFILHPDAYLPRKLILPNGYEIKIPYPNRKQLLDWGIEEILSFGPSMLFDDTTLVSGEVDRITKFEIGLPGHYSKKQEEWVKDPVIPDDQCIIINVRNKGLVIITGCGHAGIINIIRNAQKLTGIDKIYAIIGGFHLTGKIFEPLIESTVKELVKIDPSFIVPGHCTGWKAQMAIATQLGNAYVQSTVGMKILI